jgi:hypothetical protein
MFADAITAFENLLDTHFWLRVMSVLVGGVLIVFALTGWALPDRAWAIGKGAL